MIEFELINKSISASSGDDDVLHIKGLANTGLKDLQGDVLSREALDDLCKQALNHNLHIDHDPSMNGVLGPITGAEITADGVEISADVLDGPHRSRLETLLKHGVKLGMSVRGFGKRVSGAGSDFGKVVLTEISLTPIPADQGTMGSVVVVKSLSELATKIKDDEDIEETEEESMADEETFTEEKIIELINQAFNDRREEFLETIRDEVKAEYEIALNEIKEKLEGLEAKVIAGEGKEPQGDDEGNDGNNGGEGGEGDDEKEGIKKSLEELQKSFDTMKDSVSEIVDNKIEEIFKAHKSEDLSFRYDGGDGGDGSEGGEEIKKSFTPRELAELFMKNN